MAKLKDQVTPAELLETIRAGAMKNDIMKKHRASEQELAMMLLPLYRGGELTKEEFNDFFKGVPLRPMEEASKAEVEAEPPGKTEDQPPSEIFRSLTAEPTPVATEVLPEEPAPEKDEELLDFDISAVEKAVESAELDKPTALEEADFAVEQEARPVESDEELADEQEESPAAAMDQTVMSPILEMIASKLDSIDARLAAIEKKL